MATASEEQLLLQSFRSMPTDILARKRSPFLAKTAPTGPPEELIVAAMQAQAGTLPIVPGRTGNLVDALIKQQGLLPPEAMSMGFGVVKNIVKQEEVEAERKRQMEEGAMTAGLAQALAAEYPQTTLGAWDFEGASNVAETAAGVFGVNVDGLKTAILDDPERDILEAAKIVEAHKPGPDDRDLEIQRVASLYSLYGTDIDLTTDKPDKPDPTGRPAGPPLTLQEKINIIHEDWYPGTFNDKQAIAGLEGAGLGADAAWDQLAAWQQHQFDVGWLEDEENRPGAWVHLWKAGTLGETKARTLLERYWVLSNGALGRRDKDQEAALLESTAGYITIWSDYKERRLIAQGGPGYPGGPRRSQGTLLERQFQELGVLAGKGAGDEDWIVREIERLPAKEQYMTAAGNALGPRAENPTVQSYLNDRYSYEYGSYWLQGALNEGDLWVPSMQLPGQETWSRRLDRGFAPEGDTPFRNEGDIDTGWRNLVEASGPGVMGAEFDYAKDPAKYAYGRLALDNSIQVAAAMAKAGLTGQGVRGKMKLRGFMRIIDEYNQERAYKTADDADEGLASVLARKYGGAWA